MIIDLKQTCKALQKFESVCLLTHKSPDGDTLGSAFALKYALEKLNKKVMILCNDPLPEKFKYMGSLNSLDDLSENDVLIGIDLADTKLLGEKLFHLSDKISLCIDHHVSNSNYASQSFIVSDAAAAAEVVYDIIRELRIEIDNTISSCIYTGIATDTGCFKYSNTTSKTHEIAAEMLKFECDYKKINKVMFNTKTKMQIEIEKHILDSLEFYFNDRCAMVCITKELQNRFSIPEDELGLFSSLPAQIEGVLVGVTLKEKSSNEIKASVRTNGNVNASKICSILGGGGHKSAAGATIESSLEDAKKIILCHIEKTLKEEKNNERNIIN